MNFSDKTKKRLVGAVQKARYMASCDIVSGNVAATTKEIDSRIVATVLSSLTLSDLMQVDEVREIVEISKVALHGLDTLPSEIFGYISEEDRCWPMKEELVANMHQALTPFTESK